MITFPDQPIIIDRSGSTNLARLTTAQINAIPSPTEGQQVYDTDKELAFWYSSTFGWVNAVNSFTGGAEYRDGVYTSASPLTIPEGVKTTLPNAATIVYDTQKPVDVVKFYDSATQKVIGSNGDFYSLNIEFKLNQATPLIAEVTTSIDIGGTIGEIYPVNFYVTKGLGSEHYYLSSFHYYTRDTWVANGGTVKITSSQDVEVYDIRYVFSRLHKAR